ncbi:NAD(P)H-dependent amine dehydrogenase family protein [Mycolicibacterium hodleri]|nr:diacylglycerol kinase [Mycolicibacterium hodleri]
MPMKVIQWGAGYTGAHALRYLINNPAYEVVGVKCFTAAKEGTDAGEIAGLGPIGVAATRDVDALLATNADVVLYMPRDALTDPSVADSPSRGWYVDLLPILASGKNVISPICSATHYRHLADPEGFLAGLNEACATGRSTVAFFGLDPGFLTDALPLTMAGAVGEVTQIRTYEVLLYAEYTEAETLSMLGFGARPQDLPPEGIESLKVSWGGVPYLVAEATGVLIEDITVDIDVALSPDTFTSPGGVTIGEGTIAGIKFSVSGISGGAPVVVVNHVTRMRADIGPDWPNVGTVGGYRIEIDSFPPFVGDFPLGLPGGTGSSFDDAMAMTAARCVNAIDAVVAASPGYKTFLDLAPLVGQHTIKAAAVSV